MSDTGDGTDALSPIVEDLPVPPESNDAPAVNGGEASPSTGADATAGNNTDAGKAEVNGRAGNEAEEDTPPEVGRRAPEDEALRKFCRDVLLPTAESAEPRTALHEARDASFAITSKPLKAVLAQTSKLWNQGKDPIPFVFLPGDWVGNKIQHDKVRQTIKEWEQYGSFTFKEALEGDWADKYDNRIIRITFDDRQDSEDAGSWSTIGTDCTLASVKRPSMNFGKLTLQNTLLFTVQDVFSDAVSSPPSPLCITGWVHGDNARITADEKAVILHEVSNSSRQSTSSTPLVLQSLTSIVSPVFTVRTCSRHAA